MLFSLAFFVNCFCMLSVFACFVLGAKRLAVKNVSKMTGFVMIGT